MANNFGYQIGQTYFNIANSTLYVWNGTAFVVAVPGAAGGTVTSVSVVTAGGVSGSVATPTSTPAITLTLGAIAPTSVNGVSAATMAFVDPTSSIQTQLNAKAPLAAGGLIRIAQVVVAGSSTATITFSAIPGNYTSLKIIMSGQTNLASGGADAILAQFNADAGANYSYAYLIGGHTTTPAGGSLDGQTSATLGGFSGTGGAFPSQLEATLPGYSGTTFGKSFQTSSMRTTTTTGEYDNLIVSGAWNSTAAITSITLSIQTGTDFVAGTTATLYGVL